MNKKTWTWVIIAIVVIGGAWAIASHNSSSSDTGPIKIGAALGLSGGDCAIYGEGELKAVQLAIDEANQNGGIAGRKIELFSEDTQCTPKDSVNAMKKLVEADGVDAVVGLTWGDSYQAGFTVNNERKVVAVAPSTALEALYYSKFPTDYVFSTWFPEKSEMNSLQAYAKKIGVNKFVVIHDVDPYGAMLGDLFSRLANQNGLQILEKVELPIGTSDFRTVITKIKGLNPDGVAVFFQTPTARAEFLKQAHELGLQSKFFADAAIEDPSLLKNFGGFMEGLIYTYPEITGNKNAFFAKFKAKYGVNSVGASDANAYDAARVVIAALTEHYEKGTDIRDAVQNIDIPGTAVPQIKFDDTHQITGAKFQIKTIRDGQFTVVE